MVEKDQRDFGICKEAARSNAALRGISRRTRLTHVNVDGVFQKEEMMKRLARQILKEKIHFNSAP